MAIRTAGIKDTLGFSGCRITGCPVTAVTLKTEIGFTQIQKVVVHRTMIGMADGAVVAHQVCMGEYVGAFHLAMAIYTGLSDGFPLEKIVINGAMR